MAVQFNVVGEGLLRNTNIVSGAADYTAMCWWRRTAGGAGYRVILTQQNAGATKWAGITNGTVNPRMDISDGVTEEDDSFALGQLNAWMHFAYTRTGSTHRWYINGALIGTVTLDVSANAFAEVVLGADGISTLTNHEVAYFREWTAALSAADIAAESIATSAVRTANLHTDTPLSADLLDDSGNGHGWTAVGTTGFVTDPLITSIPLNSVGQAAITLSDPATVLQQVYVDGVTYDVYYTFTNSSGVDKTISYANWGTLPGALGVDYWPYVQIWLEANEETFVHEGFFNGSFGILPIPDGFTYYFAIKHQAGNYNPSPLNISFFTGPSAPAQIGNVLITAASIASWMIDAGLTGLSAGIIDVDLGEIVGYVPQMVTGEAGDILPTSGRILFTDEGGSLNGYPPTEFGAFAYYLYLYDGVTFDVLATATIPSPLSPPLIKTHAPTDKFYVLGRASGAGVRKYKTIDADGNSGAYVDLTNPGLTPNCFAVNATETVMYIGGASTSTGAVKAWDMVGLTYLADFKAAVAGYKVSDMLVLSDDSVLVCYFKTTVTRDVYVKRFDPAGTLLNTYTFTFAATLASTDPRLGTSANSPEAFWILNHLSTGYSDLRLIQVSDGAELKGPALISDPLQDDDATATPVLPRISDSCPIIELRVAAVADGIVGVIGPLVWWHFKYREVTA